MIKLNLIALRAHIQAFDFKKLFNELGWSNPISKQIKTVIHDNNHYNYQHIAQLSGVVILEITPSDNIIPDAKTRLALHEKISPLHAEHVLIFIDSKRSQSCFSWLKQENNKSQLRSHFYFRNQSGELLLSKLAAMFIAYDELDDDGNIAVVEVANRLKVALDVQPVTKAFFNDFAQLHGDFIEQIQGIDNEKDRAWYASVLLHRLMFIWFLQRKSFLDNGNINYLKDKLSFIKQTRGDNQYYTQFLQPLFFEGFAKPENKRAVETNALIGNIRYLNGGLFLRHSIEERYLAIQVNDKAFADLFVLFSNYTWNLNDTLNGNDKEINPDVLGYIFEKYINQKAFGAYYTRPEITDYLCERTISKLILDKINSDIEGLAIIDFNSLPQLLTQLDAPLCRQLIDSVLPQLSLVDPACGSGAFLVAAMKTLIGIYAAIIGKIALLNDSYLNQWLQNRKREHPSIDYFIKKEIIKNNLYGVDIMPEATEIAKLRLFLALVSSAQKVEELEPLPNIDFNIMAGNSLIGLLTVEGEKFNQLGKTGDIFRDNEAESYTKVINDKNSAIASYKDTSSYDSEALTELRDGITAMKKKAYAKLNRLLLTEFERLKIQFEQATWDDAKNKAGKPIKRALTLLDIEALQPFHWGYEFDDIFARGGFDAVITNPPWEVLKPQAKEFFADYSELVSKNKMSIKEFEKQQARLLNNADIKSAWLEYQSRFSFVSLYFRSSLQYPHQTAVVNGKKTGSDINLYKLFLEQSFNLLHDNGQCGVIVPSGIYTDLGTTGLRKMLFEQTKVSTLFGLSNEKFIFEEVHHGFKFCIFSFQKGKSTDSFNAIFRINPREAIAKEKLESFLHNTDIQVNIKTELVKKLSPDSQSIMEFKNETDITIAEKMSNFPLLGKKLENTWNLKLTDEFHPTNDSYLFKTKNLKGSLPLYEGKMIHQFTHRWNNTEAKYWLDETEARKALLGKNEDIGQVLDYQCYRLGFRDVTASTNERTMIATVLPKNIFCSTIRLESNCSEISQGIRLFLLALFNSFCFDFLMRQKVNSHVTFSILYQCPIPRLTEKDPQFKAIVERAAALICTSPEFDDLKNELSESKIAILDSNKQQLRAELDAIIAQLYGLTGYEFEHILNSFPLVKQDIKTAALIEYQRLQCY